MASLKLEQEAGRLPKTYENIMLKEKLGIGAALFQSFSAGGTLTVKPDGLDYITDKRTITVSASQVRGVSERRVGGHESDTWVVAECDDQGAGRMLAFQESSIKGEKGRLRLVKASLEALLEQSKKKE